MRTLSLIAVVALSVPTWASVTGLSVRGGYFSGHRFTGQSGRVRLEGPSLGIDYKIFQSPTGQAVYLSPTIVWGGQLKSGRDDDATIFRLMATTKLSLPGVPFYGVAGAGFATSKTRGSTRFNTATGGLIQLGIGKDLARTPVLTTFAQLSYITGREPYRGWAFELGIRF